MKLHSSGIRSVNEIQDIGTSLIKEALEKYCQSNTSILFDGSKESVFVLDLFKRVFGGKVPIPVIFNDTTFLFKEIYDYVRQLENDWDLNLTVATGIALENPKDDNSTPQKCCHENKAKSLIKTLLEMGLQCLLIGKQINEGESDYIEALAEDGINVIDVTSVFTDEEIWRYIRFYGLPYCSIYNRGYRILGCQPCIKPELFGDAQNQTSAREQAEVLGRLRALGYM